MVAPRIGVTRNGWPPVWMPSPCSNADQIALAERWHRLGASSAECPMSAVLRTVWFVETRFRDSELSLDAMAEHAGVSRSHLSRIFPVATGMQLSSYLRGRRLTEAAKELVNGAPDILNVALDVGYGSHEAFTRAFRAQFGVTPDDVRRRRSLDTLDLVEPLNMDLYSTEKVTLKPPVVE